MSNYLPRENITYISSLKRCDILDNLEAVVERKGNAGRGFLSVFFARGTKPYEGAIRGNAFRISRIIYYRNSFLPVIEGRIWEEGQQTVIEVKMRLNDFARAFIIIWMSLIALIALPMTFAVFIKHSALFLLPYGMLAFGYLLTMTAFGFEANRSRQFLADLFEAEIRQSS